MILLNCHFICVHLKVPSNAILKRHHSSLLILEEESRKRCQGISVQFHYSD